MKLAHRKRCPDEERIVFRGLRFVPGLPDFRGWIGAFCFLWSILGGPPLALAGGSQMASGQEKVLLGPPVADLQLKERRTENPLLLPPTLGRGVKLWDEVRFSSDASSGSGPHHARVSVQRTGH